MMTTLSAMREGLNMCAMHATARKAAGRNVWLSELQKGLHALRDRKLIKNVLPVDSTSNRNCALQVGCALARLCCACCYTFRVDAVVMRTLRN
eukprot:4216865-Pleurochrysis_carterae.AAC.1